MLKLKTKTLSDMIRICHILVKYDIETNIRDSTIIINNYLSDKIIDEITKSTDVVFLQNYINNVEDEKLLIKDSNQKKFPLRYPVVKRGEIYKCDFGMPYGSEQGYERYAIIVQNDEGNLHSPTTIVIACTTEIKKFLSVHIKVIFSEENMIDYNPERVGTKTNTILAEQIQTVDKSRLREYVGTLNMQFMDNHLQKIIDRSLALKRKQYIKYVYVEKLDDSDRSSKDINMIQIKILSYVNISTLLKIGEGYQNNEEKCSKILELFGFDLNKNGVQYLISAILESTNIEHFNLETLVVSLAKKNTLIESNEIKRLIVARVKEIFKMKSCTIDLIRLVNSFLKKGEN